MCEEINFKRLIKKERFKLMFLILNLKDEIRLIVKLFTGFKPSKDIIRLWILDLFLPN